MTWCNTKLSSESREKGTYVHLKKKDNIPEAEEESTILCIEYRYLIKWNF